MPLPIILVASGTAKTGSNVVEQLSATGKVSVRALTRNPDSEKAKHLATLPNVTVLQGDFLDPDSLKSALQGVTRAFLTTPGGDDQQYDREVAFIDAAMTANVEVVVRVSAGSCFVATDSPSALGRIHARIENYAQAHGSRVVNLQPGYFMSNILGSAGEAKATGKVTYPFTNEEAANMPPMPVIDTRDVAGAAVAVLLSTKEQLDTLLAARCLEVHGPEPITFAQYLAAISNAIDKPLSYNYLPPDDFVKRMQGHGVQQEMADLFKDLLLMLIGKLKTPHPIISQTSPALATIWQPKITIDKWAQEYGAAFA